MALVIDEYSYTLTSKFLFADSPDGIHTSIYTAIKELKEHKVQPYIIKRILETTIEHLQQYKATDYDSQQWANIKMGVVFLNQFKSSIADIR